MNSTLRTRFLAVVGSAALVGVLGGTAAAHAGYQAAPRSTGGVDAGCTAVSATATVQPGAEGKWFGVTHHAAE